MSLGALHRAESRVVFFRLSFDLGLAVDSELKSVISLLGGDQLPFDWAHSKSKHWMDDRADVEAWPNYDEQARGTAEANRSRNRRESPLGRRIPKDRRRSDGAKPGRTCRRASGDVRLGSRFVGGCIGEFGGVQAQRRSRTCAPALITFDHNEPGATRCSFRRDAPDVITVHIGNHLGSSADPSKGALRIFFSFPFYLFHEYLSHSYSAWQDLHWSKATSCGSADECRSSDIDTLFGRIHR